MILNLNTCRKMIVLHASIQQNVPEFGELTIAASDQKQIYSPGVDIPLIFHNSRIQYLGIWITSKFLSEKHKVIQSTHPIVFLTQIKPDSSFLPWLLFQNFRSFSLKYSNHNLTLNLSLSSHLPLNLKLLSVLLVKANSQ